MECWEEGVCGESGWGRRELWFRFGERTLSGEHCRLPILLFIMGTAGTTDVVAISKSDLPRVCAGRPGVGTVLELMIYKKRRGNDRALLCCIRWKLSELVIRYKYPPCVKERSASFCLSSPFSYFLSFLLQGEHVRRCKVSFITQIARGTRKWWICVVEKEGARDEKERSGGHNWRRNERGKRRKKGKGKAD